ncbi:Os10g0322166 [Oryza sativa Japonica Group]|uniref:Os10g0322166 protein n=1 Tax=Oryza sativa subsp. japonica TaxID=39947 RepID=A0A0P0XTH8_ORYSJ|nr:Os10g0322166 [Oryza sativa Japonica Group]
MRMETATADGEPGSPSPRPTLETHVETATPILRPVARRSAWRRRACMETADGDSGAYERWRLRRQDEGLAAVLQVLANW